MIRFILLIIFYLLSQPLLAADSCPTDQFINAVLDNNSNQVKQFLTIGCSPQAQDNLHTPVVNLARRFGYNDIVHILCEAGAQSRFCKMDFDSNLRQSLVDAVKANDLAQVEKLLQQGAFPDGEHAESFNDKNITTFPLLYAAQVNNVPVIRTLLKYGARIDISIGVSTAWGSNERNPLWGAVESDRKEAAVELLSSGAIVCSRPCGMTFSIFAILFKKDQFNLVREFSQIQPKRYRERFYSAALQYLRYGYSGDFNDTKKFPLYFREIVDAIDEVNVPANPELPLQLAIDYKDPVSLASLLKKSVRLDVEISFLEFGSAISFESAPPLGAVILTKCPREMAELLLQKGVSPNLLIKNHEVAPLNLLAAIVLADIGNEDFNFIKSAGADPQFGNPLVALSKTKEPNFYRRNGAAVLKLLKNKWNPNTIDAFTNTPLFHVIYQQAFQDADSQTRLQILKYLLENGYDFTKEASSSVGQSNGNALAICKGCSKTELTFLMEEAKVPAIATDGCSAPLRSFAFRSMTDLFYRTLELGANPNSSCSYGYADMTVLAELLMRASPENEASTLEMVEMLLNFKGHVKDRGPYTLLMTNDYSGAPQANALIRKLIQLLSNYGLKPNSQDDVVNRFIGMSLRYARYGGKWTDDGMAALIAPLVMAGAHVDETSSPYQKTALFTAIELNWLNTAKALCENHADVNLNREGTTPLLLAKKMADKTSDMRMLRVLEQSCVH